MTIIQIQRRLPLLLIQNDVLLPGSTMRIPITQPLSVNMVKSRLLSRSTLASSLVGIVTVEDVKFFEENINNPKFKVIGTAAIVLQVLGTTWLKSNIFTVNVSGVCRFSLDRLVMEEPYPVGVVTQLDYISSQLDPHLTTQCEKEVKETKELALAFLKHVSSTGLGIQELKKSIEDASYMNLPDLVMSLIISTYEERKEILYADNFHERLQKVLVILKKPLHDEYGRHPKRNGFPTSEVLTITVPNEKFRRVKSGAADDSSDFNDGVNEIEELQNRVVKANLPAEVNKVVMRDLHRLKKMGPFSPEHGVIRNYIEFVVELPWTAASPETIDIQKARKDLDTEHYGMDKVKRRVLEYLAVRQLKSSVRGPILCFVGPPGVGKTSIGRSIAHTLGREFQRISLGGVSNQSDIRGHRRTYVGAMPGRIIQAVKNAGVNNPVILLDEIDKMSSGIHGDPAAALLEVLDPLQNHHFLDHYLNVPFDLSQVTFIATANMANNIPAPLLDRMETISVSGYTTDEKIHIAEHHLLPKQLKENGLDDTFLKVPVDSIKVLIESYTSEAGVRNLERKLGALCRAVAVKVAEKENNTSKTLALPFEVTHQALEDILGPPVYSETELWSRVGVPGVAVGLSWTVAGGKVLLVEATKLSGGEGKLILTGQLGSVMRESARLAFNWVRSAAQQYGFVQEGEDLLHNTDVHIHFPAGAVSKDGPSAGITIASALMSLFADVPLISGLAMSGELTLRGTVLPVGGIKEKLLAAHSAGLRKVILPKLCMKDLFYVPQSIKDDLSFLFVSHMEEVIDAAFDSLVAPIPHSNLPFHSRL